GIMIGSKDFLIKESKDVSDRKLLHTFITQFYSKEIIPPSEIIVPVIPEKSKLLEKWLRQQKGTGIKISSPKTGKKKELVDMASENAYLTYSGKKESGVDSLLNEIKERLQLKKLPEDIGAFDVSTISGSESVGAFVYWSEGEFKKDMYRRIKIKTVQGVDDYSMMEEIIGRIIKNLEGKLPDLIIIDGGKGQLEVAKKVFNHDRALFLELPMLVAIAKNPDRAYLTTSNDPVFLDDGRQSSLLLKMIRDEVHRFAVSYHRKLRDKDLMESPLEKIPGIGKKRRLDLLRHFGSIEAIRNASIEEIAKLKSFNKKVAEDLLHELRRGQ
ncbi:MAG: helix-hairpin-helix domain-containing protein, partial [Nitrospirota bacterium]|nr:helix-hairpin-helix domain-containing protein [Nitrospirota bacterium]